MIASLLVAFDAAARYNRREAKAPATVSRSLHHAARTVPFYKELRSSTLRLEDFPFVKRSMLNEHGPQFLSTAFRAEQLLSKSTSGSSGVPLTVYRDEVSQYPFAFGIWGELFRSLPGLRRPLPFTAGIAVVNDNPLLRDLVFANPSVQSSLLRLAIIGKSTEQDERVAAVLARERAPLLHGSPRSLIRLGEIAQAANAEIRPQVVLSGGDNLYANDRAEIERMFEAPVFNSYGSVEAGVIGVECAARTVMHINARRAHCEVLRDDETASASGSGQLVITNLDNLAMCFPRYVTGDLVELVRGACSCGHDGVSISRIDGRVSIYFNVAGKRINPAVFNALFERCPVKQFQLRQVAESRFSLRVVPRDSSWSTEAGRTAIEEGLRAHLGPVYVDTELVDSIGDAGQKVQRYVSDVSPTGALR